MAVAGIFSGQRESLNKVLHRCIRHDKDTEIVNSSTLNLIKAVMLFVLPSLRSAVEVVIPDDILVLGPTFLFEMMYLVGA
jgi:hypothetical protein